jgi:DNA polymerase-1
VLEIRKLEKLVGTFIESYIQESHVNGFVYGQFHPLRGDSGGTRSGRFSSSTPNLQNIPSRDPVLAPLIRSMFVPDVGHAQWRRYDYSQIEYRFLVHFAHHAHAARQQYLNDPKTDYHEFVLDMVAPVAGWDISTKDLRKIRRKPLKNINFGLIYGMGFDKLVRTLGLSDDDGRKLFDAVPYAKPFMEECAEFAQSHGYIPTILGRRSRFDLFEPARTGRGQARPMAFPYGQAFAIYGSNIKRAYTHKATNRKLQGSAADLCKMGMYQCWKDGLFDAVGVPRLQVHDELDFSDPGGKDEVFREIQHIMENAIKLSIPVIAECEVGPDWGTLDAL